MSGAGLVGELLDEAAPDQVRIRLAAAVEEAGEAPEGVETDVLAAVEHAVVTTYHGPISGIADAWQALGAHLAEEGLETGGVCREVCQQVGAGPADEWVLELQQPLG